MKWVDCNGMTHTRYFGHWSDDLKQDAAATTHNMCAELSVNGNPQHHVERLSVGGTVWKESNGAAVSYQCGKSIYGHGKLSCELSVSIDVQVEAPGQSESDKRYIQQCMCSVITPEVTETNW